MVGPPLEKGLAVVAGGRGALGREVVRLAMADGWDVIATARALPPDTERAGARWVAFDPAKSETDAALADHVARRPPLRAIFFCIGSPSSKRSVAETTPEEFERLYRDNVVTLVSLWRALATAARLGSAALVAIGSDATATVRAGNGPYTAAKSALEALVVTLAKEEAPHGVRANVLAPSLLRSPMAETIIARKGVSDVEDYYNTLPWGRPLTAEEVARAAIDLALSQQWRYVSGQVFRMAIRDSG